MKTCNGKYGWRPVLGVVAAGILACSLSLHGAPSDNDGVTRGAKVGSRGLQSSLVAYPDGIPSSRIGRVAPVYATSSAAELFRVNGEVPLLILEGVDQPSAGMIAARTGGPAEGECELDIECDACDPCLVGECVSGGCVISDAVECAPCNDPFFCNGYELCDGFGLCVDITGQVRLACDAGAKEGLGCAVDEDCPDGHCVEEKMPTDPCDRFPALICDEDAVTGSVAATGACVTPCDPEAVVDTCDDGMDCNGVEQCTPQECVGSLAGNSCTTNAECGVEVGDLCGGVCRTISPPPCGTNAVCKEGTPYTCGWGRCCDPACSREKLAGCTGDWLALGDRANTTEDDGDCDILAAPNLPNAGEDYDCPEYSSGIVEGTSVVELLGPAGVGTCRPYKEIGDDYKLAGCTTGDEWFAATTIRFVGGFPDGVGSRMRVTFYDMAGNFIEDVITSPAESGTEVLRTVIFTESPVIPCEGYMALKPAEEFSQDNLSSWWSTGVVEAGTNDPTRLWIDGAPCLSCAELTSPNPHILAFEIVGDYTSEPVGACCDVESGVCTEEVRWDCEGSGNLYQGNGTGCIVCSNDPFVSCSTDEQCIICDGGEREGEPCGANPDLCPNGGTCNGTDCIGGDKDLCEGGDRDGEACGANACFAGTCDGTECVGGANDGDPCDCPAGGTCLGDPCGCPGGTCDDTTGECNRPREACLKSACCDPAGDCLETTGGFCTNTGTCSVTTATTCAIAADCPSGETCVGADTCLSDVDCDPETCEAPCEPGSISQGFGTSCENNCCEQPIYAGWDTCALARTNVVVLNVTTTLQTLTFTGDNKQATFDDHTSGTCEAGIFDEDGGTRDRGWWHAFSLDSGDDNCSDIRIDMCCSEPIHQPQWAFLYSDCDPCGGVYNNTTAPPPIGNGIDGNDRGDPFCPNDNLWQTWTRLRDGIYYHPIYTATGGHFGQYQLHITAVTCPVAACCLPDGSCELYNELDCDEAGGYWLGFGNLPSNLNPVISCEFGACDFGACCLGPGQCQDDDGAMDRDLCVTTLGGTYYGGAQCDYPKQPCPTCEIQGEANCQATVGAAAGNYAGSSDLGIPPTGTAIADDFIPSGDSLKTICVWGTYMDDLGDGPTGSEGYEQFECVWKVPDGDESFRVRVYADSVPPGQPGALVGEQLVYGDAVGRGPVDSPGFFWTGFNVHGWTLELPTAIPLIADETHWLEVASNRNICPNGECEDGYCVSGDREGQSCNPDSTCWWSWYQTYQEDGFGNAWSLFGTDDRPDQNMEIGSGYVNGSGKSVDVQFCLGGPTGPLAFTLPDPPTGCCCDCEDTTTENVTLVHCELELGGVWTRDALCSDEGTCFNEGDDCLGARGQIAAGGLNCQSAPGESGALVVSDGLTGFDTTCYTTDGPEFAGGGSESALGKDIWFAYTTTCTGELVASMCMSGNGDGGYDSFMAMYHDPDFPDVCMCPGEGPPPSTTIGVSDEGCNGIADEGSGYMDGMIVFPGECYLVRLGGWGRNSEAAAGAGRGLVDIACTASLCFPSTPPEPETLPDLFGNPISQKGRYLSFIAQDDGHTGYVRVTFVDLPAPYDSWNGVEMYVNPPLPYCENAGVSTPVPPATECPEAVGGLPSDTFLASTLSCSPPEAYDWASAGVVHVFDEGIVPLGIYHIQMADSSCSTGVESSFSDPLVMQQTKWGDCVEDCTTIPCSPPLGTTNTGIGDVTAVLDKWKNLPGNLMKARADMEGSPAGDHRVPDQAINITDVTYTLGAFLGQQYPGPGFPPPSPRPCTGFIAGAP